MNKRTLRVLEYYKIIERLTSFATCPAGKRMCERLKPSTDPVEITKSQEETADALKRVYQQGSLSFSGVYPIGEAMKRVAVGASLSIPELLDVAKLLQVAGNARQYGEQSQDKGEEGVNTRQDSLTGYFESLMTLEHLSREINRCILSEDEIADEMGTSRTPVREAVNQLSQNGFIKYIKRKGLYCVQYNRDELESLLELRETLEEFSYIHCANMAKKEDIERLQNIIKQFNSLPDQEKEKQHAKCDVSFHVAAAEITNNERLVKYIKEIETLLLIVRKNLSSSVQVKDIISLSWLLHDQIVDAIAKKDISAIKKLNQEHIELMRKTQLDI